MKILILSSLYPEPSELGIVPDTKAVHYFAREWVTMGNQVLVLHPYWNPVSRISRVVRRKSNVIEYSIDDVPVIFSESQILFPHHLEPCNVQQKLTASHMLKYLRMKYCDFYPDVIVSHMPTIAPDFSMAIMSEFPNARKVCTLHGVDLRNVAKKPKSITILDAYDRILFRSYSLNRKGTELGVCSNPQDVVLSGIDNSLIRNPEELSNLLAIKSSKKLSIVFAGKLVAQKRIDSIIRSLSMLPADVSYDLTIIGDGNERKNLENLTRELNLQDIVTFTGKMPREDVSKRMGLSDIFVMVSKGETLGLVYLEAMGQGCIPIGSSGEGIDGIIKDSENGFLCVPEDEKGLAEIIKTIYNMTPSERAIIAQRAYDTVREMTSKNMANKYLELITK